MNLLGVPPQASTMAPKVDALLYAVTGVTGAVAVAIFVTLVVFSVRYRKAARAHAMPKAEKSRLQKRMEIAWTATPLLLFFAAFVWAGRLYIERGQPPADAMKIFVVAKQWMWKAQHAGGQREISELHVPLGQPVVLVMTSQDVIHSFFVPAFRAKQDVLPGRYTELWFTATQAGRFHLFCAEYCGTDHSRMGGDIVVMKPAEFQRWLAAHPAAPDMAARGAALFRQYGCSGCHDRGSTVRAPALEGLYGKPVPLADGTVAVADDRYLRDSILLPLREVVAGFDPIMPSYAGRIADEDVADLIAYIQSLAPVAGAQR
jgi:cytochrome c oxidase subunit 2